MKMRVLVAVLVAVTTVWFAPAAYALMVDTSCRPQDYAPPDSVPLGIADNVDAGNAVKTDDALVCLNVHTLGAFTQAMWRNEVANTGAHEFGHLVGLAHADDPTMSFLMDGPYDGVNKAHSAGSLVKLNALTGNQVVWLDFEAASAELPPGAYLPFEDAPAIATLGLTDAQIDALIDQIFDEIVADYLGPFTAGATFAFSLTQPGAGDYSTVSFVATPVPEPSSLLLLLTGGGALAFLRRRRSARRSSAGSSPAEPGSPS